MAEGGGLLNRYTLQRRIEGSNPSVSASVRIGSHFQSQIFSGRAGYERHFANCSTVSVGPRALWEVAS